MGLMRLIRKRLKRLIRKRLMRLMGLIRKRLMGLMGLIRKRLMRLMGPIARMRLMDPIARMRLMDPIRTCPMRLMRPMRQSHRIRWVPADERSRAVGYAWHPSYEGTASPC
jgi:hypothetical protein